MSSSEARRFYQKGQEHFNHQEYENALQYFRKSYKLEQNEAVLNMIKKCEEELHEPAPGPSQNFSRSQSDPTGGASSENRSEDIKRLLAKKDFYDILGVNKTATKEEITKAYRKLALKYHPDKCKEVGADEAFKKLAQAYDCLSTEEKRQKYDEFGNEEPEQHYRHYRQYYHDDIRPEDIFQMFFGNAFFEGNMPRQRFVFQTYNFGGQPRRHQHRRNGEEHQQQQAQGGFKFLPLLQFLPILIIIIASLGLNFSHDEPLYSLSQNHKHAIQRQTYLLKVPYFVDRSFDSTMVSKPTKLRALEETIEKEHVTVLNNRCQYIKQQKASYEKLAEFSQGDVKDNYIKRAASLDYATCEKVNDYRTKAPHLFR